MVPTEQIMIDPARTALLLMDFQQGIVDMMPAAEDAVAHAAKAAGVARAAGIHIGHVRVAFRPGHPEVSARNKGFAPVAAAGLMAEGDSTTLFHPQVVPAGTMLDAEFVVTKTRVNAFSGTDLDQILRAADVDTLVLAGLATSGVVLSTLRDAADRDYRVLVLADATADPDPEVHRVLLAKVFPTQAEVLDTATFVSAVAAGMG
ncbi:cysteine hydrolase family protein [Actinocrispum wychmicini]|uniref:Nicotinamidase-related amidase n=1 Tax=Actinocrispum wychmicini TaxID=1213861 RepID=A0A4R2J938_9PSEU|nr:cysteine hydrolase [Actinocrispum wychmicini]TCO55831.1 nicotinamidase-related amidase [Actinocrispum wychmicini]